MFILFDKGGGVIKRIDSICALTLSGECKGRFSSVQYDQGNINLIFAVPHNGYLKPVEIDDRRNGCKRNGECRYGKAKCGESRSRHCKIGYVADAHTQGLARLTQEEFFKLTGKKIKPHLVISNLYRAKMDPNRPREEAAQGNSRAEGAFDEYHNQIKEAKNTFGAKPGLLIDFHGHQHEREITEIGYRVTKDELIGKRFNSPQLSIKSLIKRKNAKIEDFLFGPESLGALFNSAGYEAVPSPDDEAPREEDKYFRGGYSILTHGSNGSGNVDGIQLEFPAKLRKKSKRRKLAKDLAKMLTKFYLENYEENLKYELDLGVSIDL